MILSIVLVVILIIVVAATLITKSIFDGIRREVAKSITSIPESIDADLEVLKVLRIIK